MKTISEQSDVAILTSDQPGKVVEDYEQSRFTRRETLLTMFGVLHGHVASFAGSDNRLNSYATSYC